MSPLRSLYDWSLRQAEGRYAAFVLFAVAFAESSFFPVPPDVLLLPMALAARSKAFFYAAICTLGSVLGGLLGYAIGSVFFATVGSWIIDTYHLQEAFQRFHESFNEWGVWAVVVAGFSPIPFKLVTIASGVVHFDLVAFVVVAALTRGARFSLVALLAYWFGEPIRQFVERYLTWVFLGVLGLIILGFWVALR